MRGRDEVVTEDMKQRLIAYYCSPTCRNQLSTQYCSSECSKYRQIQVKPSRQQQQAQLPGGQQASAQQQPVQQGGANALDYDVYSLYADYDY